MNSMEVSTHTNKDSISVTTVRDDDTFPIKINININPEDLTVVWLDVNVHQHIQASSELRRMCHTLVLFEKQDDCHCFLETMSSSVSDKVLVIVSGSLGKTFVPTIHEYKQILFIYIFCRQYEEHKSWACPYRKIGDNRIVTRTQDLFDRIVDDIHCILEMMVPVNIFSKGKEQTIHDLDKESASAMWFQLVIDVLVNMEEKSNTKDEMIRLCDLLYSDNVRVQDQIIHFKNNYQSQNAVLWYTKNTFLYRVLNKALRIKNIDVIYPFRFFIADLHRQLSRLHMEFIEYLCTDTLTVYRGQQLTADEIQNLKMNINGLVSFNTFLSTTLNPEVAFVYAGQTKDVSVLFRIEIDIRSNTKVPFGSIAHVSQHRSEDEVLFSIGAIFRIVAVDQINDVYHITLKISDNENEEMKRLFEFYYKDYKINEPTTLITLGMILHEMGQFDQAAYYYQLMLQNSNASHDYDTQAKLYKQLGYVAKTQAHYEQAISDYNSALSLVLEHNPTNYKDLYEIYNNLGVAHRYLINLDAALEFMLKALDLQTNYIKSSDYTLSQVYNNLGQVYRSRKEYTSAESCFLKSLDIFTHSTTIPSNHPNRATLLSNLAHLYSEMERFDEAISKLTEVLTFQLKVLPENHPNVGRTYNNLACVYLNKKENYKTAIRYLKKTLEIDSKNLSPDHPWTTRVYMNIARVYYARHMYLIGWLYAKKAMDRRHTFQVTGPDYSKCEELFETGRTEINRIISTHAAILTDIEESRN